MKCEDCSVQVCACRKLLERVKMGTVECEAFKPITPLGILYEREYRVFFERADKKRMESVVK